MSSNQQTTNLGLPIYGNNDVPDWKDTNTPFQTLDDIIGQGGGGSGSQVQLDFANPLHTFSSGNTSWTATEDCWLAGTIQNDSSPSYITIDSTQVYKCAWSGNIHSEHPLPITRVSKGSVVECSVVMPHLRAYRGTIVSGEVTVFNEAEVELNYTTPLHDFSTGNLSYTASKTCWLCGYLSASQNTTNNITINGKMYAWVTGGNANYTENSLFIPPIRINRGNTVTVAQNSPDLHILEGTISGSVGAIGYPDLDLDNPLYINNSGAVVNYTCTQDCYMFGAMNATGADITSNLLLNGNIICHGATGLITPIPLLKLHSGDIVTSSKGINNGYLMICKER